MVEIETTLDIIRLITGVAILGYASYTDIKTRRASNYLWVIMAVVGIALLAIQYFTTDFENQNIVYLIFIPIMIGMMYVFFQLRLLFGGADAKALMALAILVPFFPTMSNIPVLGESVMPFSWIILANSVIIFLFIPLSLFIFNAAKKNIEFPYCILGYKMSVETAKVKFVWPLEKIKDGKRKFVYVPKEFDIDDELAEFEKAGINEIWVTPKIPFMIPLFIGFIVSFILGDIMTHLMQLII